MLNNLKRYYNQNRKKIWMVIIIIAFAFAMLQLANTIGKNNSERIIREATAQTKTQTTEANNEANIVSNEDKSTSTSNSSTQTSETNDNVSTIKQFVTFCNGQNFENAYNMLTNDCKEEIFSDIEIFKNIYYSGNFENKNIEASIQKWANNTYRVTYAENALATGKIAKTKDDQTIDFITVVEDEEGYKLNINSYIGYEEIGQDNEKDNVKIEVLGKHTYMDYETYTVKVTNKSNSEVVLDSLYNPETIYIEDSRGVKYPSYTNELSEALMTIGKGYTKELNIKFYSSYISSKRIKQIVFSDFQKNGNRIKFNVEI